MSEKSVPPGKWKKWPYDPRCKAFVDQDQVVEDQIRCRVPLWSGNFDELIADLVPHRVTLDQLPLLTVHQIGLFMINTSQGGSLRVGPVGTAAHTIDQAPPLAQAVDDSEHERIARQLERVTRRVLWFMRENGARSAVEKLTKQFIADNLGLTIDDVTMAGDAIRAAEKLLGKPMLESKPGCAGGWWLSPDGDRIAQHCAPPSLTVAAPLKLARIGANRGE